MSPRLVAALIGAVLFALAGFTAMNEAGSGLRLAYVWFGLAMAASIVAIALPSERSGS